MMFCPFDTGNGVGHHEVLCEYCRLDFCGSCVFSSIAASLDTIAVCLSSEKGSVNHEQ